jgi:biopolymer transport protein ExbD
VEVRESKPENIIISVDRTGNIFWYDARVPNTTALVEKLKKVAVLQPQPEVQIRGDLTANYDGVGKIIYACQRAGMTKVGFLTEPPARGG